MIGSATRGVTLSTAAALAACLTASAGASAQGVSVQAQYGAPPPVTAQYAQPQYGQPQYAQPQYAQPQPVDEDGPGFGRFRSGFDAGLGWLFAGGVSGPSIVISGRFGWQVNHLLGVFYQPTLPIGFASGTIGAESVSGAAIVFGNAIMGEVTLAHIFSVGLGPSLDFVAGRVCGASDVSCVGSAGTTFGVQARASVNLGTRSPYRRRGFRLGVSSHTVFAGDVFQFVDIHAGWEAF